MENEPQKLDATASRSDQIEILDAPQDISEQALYSLAVERAQLNPIEVTRRKTAVAAMGSDAILTDAGNTDLADAERLEMIMPQADETPEEIFDHMRQLLRQKQLYIVKFNGEIAGAIGIISQYYKTEDGRDYWTITRAVVDRNQRDKGLSRKLAAFALQRIREANPDSPIWIITREPKIMHLAKTILHSKKVELFDESDQFASQRLKMRGKEHIEKEAAEGNVYFIYDPKNSDFDSASAEKAI